METILLIGRLVLAVVFGVAGAAKAADPAGTRRALVGFGVPASLAAPMGWSLAWVEIIVGFALLPLNTAWLGGIAALALLTVFVAGIGYNLARGNSPDCHCFGQIHSEPVSWRTMVRSLVLAAIAGFIALEGKENPGKSAFDWVIDLKTGEIINLVMSAGAVTLMAGAVVYLRKLLSQQSALLGKIEAMKKVIDEDYAEPPLEREDAAAPLEGLPVGAPAPDFSLNSISGKPVTLEDLLAYGKPALLLFVSPNCFPCEALLPIIKTWEQDYERQLTIALISKGSAKDNKDLAAKYGPRYLLVQDESAIADDYLAKWTPAAVIVNGYGRISTPIAYGDEAIRAMVLDTVSPGTDPGRPPGNGHEGQVPQGAYPFAVGDPAPAFSVEDLEGKMVNSEDLRGRDTLLLFWDPGCPFCQAMTEDVVKWEANPPKSAPRLVFVASGESESIKSESLNFGSQFLHDKEFVIGPLFGTNSTPSAVLIDRDGRLASNVVLGLPNVLALAGIRKAVPAIPSNS
jgi:peroxiredoxin